MLVEASDPDPEKAGSNPKSCLVGLFDGMFQQTENLVPSLSAPSNLKDG
jgi:hypothetical protein